MTLILSAPTCPTCHGPVEADRCVLIVRPEPEPQDGSLGRLFAYHAQCLPVALYQCVVEDVSLKLAS